MDVKDVALWVHLASLGVAVCAIVVADLKGQAWIRGAARTLPTRTIHILHEVVSLSLISLILTGLYMFWPMREYLLQQPFFIVKLCLIATLIINSLVINWLMGAATQLPFSEISGKGRALFLLSGAVSTLAWIGAIAFAFLQFGLAPFGI